MRNLVVLVFLLLLSAITANGGVIVDFDDIPTNELASELPGASGVGNGPTWTYSLRTDYGANRDQWVKNTEYTLFSGIYNRFFGSGGGVAGVDRLNYGYYDIVSGGAYSGRALRYVGTGGADNAQVIQGQQVRNKLEYLSYSPPSSALASVPVGNPYLYIMNGTNQNNEVPFEESVNADRLEFYVKMTPETSVGNGGYSVGASPTFHVGTFEDHANIGNTSHWYHYIYINGGTWVKMSIDNHPTYNNAGLATSGPSNSMSSFLSSEYIQQLYALYLAPQPYAGHATPPHYTYFDDIKFVSDAEPQNNETINSIAIGYWASDNHFEIGFADKYLNNEYCRATYQVRYSFSPITNLNWASATPAVIPNIPGFGIDANNNGYIRKWWPYYQGVWSKFNLASPSDIATFQSNRTIYIAVKDVSQDPTDYGEGAYARINSTLTGNFAGQGRDYVNQSARFSYSVDVANLPLIKRVSYTLPSESGDTTPPTTTASPAAGTYTSTQSVTLTANETATIYFTTNGDTPTVGGPTTTVYSSPISVSSTKTIKYFARDTAGNNEVVKSASYTIQAPLVPITAPQRRCK